MNYEEIRSELDLMAGEAAGYSAGGIPGALLEKLGRWRWGSYGWVSPASLLVTAAWHKYYFPEIDCCRIWAEDENGAAIPGGYSIRSADEGVTIPVLAKHGLCGGFCSANSGMQGSRAIEKMRSMRRLNRDFDGAQRTVFDLKLFADIMNDINELDHSRLPELLRWFFCKARGIQERRRAEDAALLSPGGGTLDIELFLAGIHDPELTKCVAAACLEALFSPGGVRVTGVSDARTAADARAGKPGDLALELDGETLAAVEVKDKSQGIDWQNIARARTICARLPGLRSFLFVLENSDAASGRLVREILLSPQLASADGRRIDVVALRTLLALARAAAADGELVRLVSRNIAAAPGVKPETRAAWLGAIGLAAHT